MIATDTATELTPSFLARILDFCDEGVAVLDARGLVRFANPALADIFGLPQTDLVGQPLPLTIEPGMIQEVEILPQKFNRRDIDRPRPTLVRSLQLPEAEGGRIVYLRDLTQHRERHQARESLTLKDELTRLYTFRTFLKFAEHHLEIAKRMNRQLILARIRLANLAEIRQQLGVKTINAALTDLAEILITTFRKSDLLSRYGPDEFALLAINAPGIHQRTLCTRLEAQVAAFNRQQRRPYTLQFTCGCGCFDPRQPVSLEELLEAAEHP